jgi:hypothetical protein
MGAQIDRVINITIDRQTKAVSQKGFGTMLLLADDSFKPGGQTTRTRTYDSESFKDDFTAGLVFQALTDYFSQALTPEKVIVGYVEGVETIAAALTAISNENDDWYAVGLVSRLQADAVAVAAYVSTLRKIAGFASADAGLKAATVVDLAGVLNLAGYSRAFTMYQSEAATKFADCAWFGRMLPYLPGQATFKFKSLVGISADKFTGTEITNLTTKKSNWYNQIGGVNMTEEGWMADGSFIDEIIGVDWIHARMQEAILSRLVNLPKVPYTDKGIDVIANEMEAVLKRAENQGILVPGQSIVTKPKILEIPFNDRASRTLPDMKFSGILQGAVHKVKINGVVTV